MSRGGGKVCFQQECEDSQSTQRLEEPCFCGSQTLFSAPLMSSWIATHSWLVAEETTQPTGNQKDPQICLQTMQQARTSHCVSPPPIFFTPDFKHPIHPQSQELILGLIKDPLKVGSPVLGFSGVQAVCLRPRTLPLEP